MKKVLVALVAVLVLFGCKKDQVTKGGYAYTVKHNNAEGQKVQDKDYVFISVAEKIGENERKNPNLSIVKMDFAQEKKTTEPLVEILETAQVGDSIKVLVPVDSIPNLPEELKKEEFLNLKVYVDKVMSEKDFLEMQEKQRKEAEAIRQKLQEKTDAVSVIINKDIDTYKRSRRKFSRTKNGVRFIVHEKGNGPQIKKGDLVNVMYYGALLKDKKMFDNSFMRGMPIPVSVGEGMVIKGWEEGLQALRKGDKATIIVPSKLGYGAKAQGPIPANSSLAFYVEIAE